MVTFSQGVLFCLGGEDLGAEQWVFPYENLCGMILCACVLRLMSPPQARFPMST